MFTDETIMPIGKKYKGVALKDIPASYFKWLEEQIIHTAPNKRTLAEKYLMSYIEDNKDVFDKELGIKK